jgi:hypothetical protein
VLKEICGGEHCLCSVTCDLSDCHDDYDSSGRAYYRTYVIMDYNNMPVKLDIIHITSDNVKQNCKRITNLPYHVSYIAMYGTCEIYLDSTTCASQKYKININGNGNDSYTIPSIWHIFNHFNYEHIEFRQFSMMGDCQAECGRMCGSNYISPDANSYHYLCYKCRALPDCLSYKLNTVFIEEHCPVAADFTKQCDNLPFALGNLECAVAVIAETYQDIIPIQPRNMPLNCRIEYI